MALALYFFVTASVLALCCIEKAARTAFDRSENLDIASRVIAIFLVGAIVYATSFALGLFNSLLTVLVMATLIVAAVKANSQENIVENRAILFAGTLLLYLGPTALFIGCLWISAPQMTAANVEQIVVTSPELFANALATKQFKNLLESKYSNANFAQLKRSFDTLYPKENDLSLFDILSTRDSICHAGDVLRIWDLARIDAKAKRFLFEMPHEKGSPCDVTHFFAPLASFIDSDDALFALGKSDSESNTLGLIWARYHPSMAIRDYLVDHPSQFAANNLRVVYAQTLRVLATPSEAFERIPSSISQYLCPLLGNWSTGQILESNRRTLERCVRQWFTQIPFNSEIYNTIESNDWSDSRHFSPNQLALLLYFQATLNGAASSTRR